MNNYQGAVMHATGWFLVLLDGWEMHTHWVAALGFFFLIYSLWSICMDGAKESVTEKSKTCQVCRLLPAVVKGVNSRGSPQWRCQSCHGLKNRVGFTERKQ